MLLIVPLLLLVGYCIAGYLTKKQPWVYLYGIITGWFLSIASCVLYIGGQYYYHNTLTSFLGFSKYFWGWISSLPVVHTQRDLLITLLNFGICLFLYGFALYALNDGAVYKALRSRWIEGAIASLLLLQTLLLNPHFYRWIEMLYRAQKGDLYQLYFFMNRYGAPIFRALDLALLLLAIFLFFYRYLQVPVVRALKQGYLYKCIALTLLAVGYFVLFSWYPILLIRPTSVSNYFLYNVPNMTSQMRFINYFLAVSLLLFIVTLALVYRYNAILNRDRGIRVKLDQSTKTASMGMRIFTHAMKNELQAIRSEAEYLHERLADDEKTAYSLSLIRDSCTRALDTIDANYATLKSRQYHLLRKPLNEVIEASVDRFEGKYPNVAIQSQMPGHDVFAYLDKPNLQAALDNILDNAAEAILNGGGGDGLVRLDVRVFGEWIGLSIADNGPGIGKEDIEHIFEPFYSTKSSATNWGVGLSFCYSTITAHDGTVTVQSEPGGGTTFKVMLPLA